MVAAAGVDFPWAICMSQESEKASALCSRASCSESSRRRYVLQRLMLAGQARNGAAAYQNLLASKALQCIQKTRNPRGHWAECHQSAGTDLLPAQSTNATFASLITQAEREASLATCTGKPTALANLGPAYVVDWKHGPGFLTLCSSAAIDSAANRPFQHPI